MFTQYTIGKSRGTKAYGDRKITMELLAIAHREYIQIQHPVEERAIVMFHGLEGTQLMGLRDGKPTYSQTGGVNFNTKKGGLPDSAEDTFDSVASILPSTYSFKEFVNAVLSDEINIDTLPGFRKHTEANSIHWKRRKAVERYLASQAGGGGDGEGQAYDTSMRGRQEANHNHAQLDLLIKSENKKTSCAAYSFAKNYGLVKKVVLCSTPKAKAEYHTYKLDPTFEQLESRFESKWSDVLQALEDKKRKRTEAKTNKRKGKKSKKAETEDENDLTQSLSRSSSEDSDETVILEEKAQREPLGFLSATAKYTDATQFKVPEPEQHSKARTLLDEQLSKRTPAKNTPNGKGSSSKKRKDVDRDLIDTLLGPLTPQTATNLNPEIDQEGNPSTKTTPDLGIDDEVEPATKATPKKKTTDPPMTPPSPQSTETSSNASGR